MRCSSPQNSMNNRKRKNLRKTLKVESTTTGGGTAGMHSFNQVSIWTFLLLIKYLDWITNFTLLQAAAGNEMSSDQVPHSKFMSVVGNQSIASNFSAGLAECHDDALSYRNIPEISNDALDQQNKDLN